MNTYLEKVSTNWHLLLLSTIYFGLFLYTLNNGYFWDNIQQTSIVAHGYYLSDFTSFLPNNSLEQGITTTGYHPPLIGAITAILWKILGYKLWVSHLLSLFCSFVLIFCTHALSTHFIHNRFQRIVSIILITEPTVLSQFAIASIDFVLLTAFVLTLYAIVKNRPLLLFLGLLILSGSNFRGFIAAVALIPFHILYEYMRQENQGIRKNIFLPYIFSLVCVLTYLLYVYVRNDGMTNHTPYSAHYDFPKSIYRIKMHLIEFGLRCCENGRFFVWMIALTFILPKIFRNPKSFDSNLKPLLLLFALLFGVYFLFVFITVMPFSSRYFMPFYFVLCLAVCRTIIVHAPKIWTKVIFLTIIFSQVTGHLWIYREPITIGWDTTLAHLPFYELREKCLDYIKLHNIPLEQVSGGFCLYGNQKFIDLKLDKRYIDNNRQKRYFIFSNVSNLDEHFFYELRDPSKWKPLAKFKKGYVDMILYENIASTRI